MRVRESDGLNALIAGLTARARGRLFVEEALDHPPAAVKGPLRYSVFELPIARLFVAFEDAVILSQVGGDLFSFEDQIGDLGYDARSEDAPPDLRAAVNAVADGAPRFEYPVDVGRLGRFQQQVLSATRSIPRGEVRPYGWVAREIGRPAAVRAVGTALANNPIPYFIPCHRVVRTDGHIGNYGGGGPEAKKAILTLEGVRVKKLEELGRSGIRYQGVRTTKIFCFPTCHTGRHALEKNIVWLHDEASARAAGFRPCKVCRPAVVA